jgi:hypothetical protein
MFQLHDKIRRRICIAAFAMFGVLPALLAGGWCVARHLPGIEQAEAEQLGRQLGLAVKLQKATHVRPGVVRYEGVELADLETGQTILRCRRLEIAQKSANSQNGRENPGRPTFSATALRPEIDATAVDRAWRWLQRLLENQAGRWEIDLQFSAAEVALRDGDRSQTLTDVTGFVETLPGGTQARADFRLAGIAASEPAYLRVVRNREASPPATGFELYTGDGVLPCDAMAVALPELKSLGSQCRFRGRVWAKESADGWQGEITGQLLQLDLGRLVTAHFPYRMTGSGEANIASARFCDGRLMEGAGTLKIGPGTLDRSLAAAAVERLGLMPGDRLLSPIAENNWAEGNSLAFKQLAAVVVLDARGLQLRGCCDTSGTILSDGRRCLLGESTARRPQPTVALVRMLAPASETQVPAGGPTDWLLRHLPPLSDATSSVAETASSTAAASDTRRR